MCRDDVTTTPNLSVPQAVAPFVRLPGMRVKVAVGGSAHKDVMLNPPQPSAQVYDGTPFLKDHPGGADSIMLAAGQDASDEFDAIHSTKAKAMLEDYYIGELAADTAGAALW